MVKSGSPIVLWFLSVVFLAVFAGTALAEKRVALVIGNSQYSLISPQLRNPANDAKDLAQALEGIGFEVILKTDLGKQDFDLALMEFARKAMGADAALFYYAGHGLQYHSQNFFLPTDIEVQDVLDVEYRAVHQDRILRAIDHAAGVRIVILDACRDNPLAKQLTARSLGGGGPIPHGLARIDSAEETIVAFATAPDRVADDGTGRNSPFTAALIRRIREPGLEIQTMFRRVANDVYERTSGRQQPGITSSLRKDYFLNPEESDSAAWDRLRPSTDPADFKKFIKRFPASPYVRDAQFRIDLFERIRREAEENKRLAQENEKKRLAEEARKKAELLAQEAEKKRQEEAARKEAQRLALETERKRREEAARKEAERLAFEAEKKRQEEEARKETKRLALEAEKKRQEDEAKKEAERLALVTEKKRQEEEAKKEAERLGRLADAKSKEEAAKKEAERLALEAERKHQEEEAKQEAARRLADQRAAEERARVAAREVEDNKKQEAGQERQRLAVICDSDRTTLKELTGSLQAGAIEKLSKETACPALKPEIAAALKKVAGAAKHACDADRKTLGALKGNDIESLKAAAGSMTCETVRAEAQLRIARLEDENKRKSQSCANEKAKYDAVDPSAFEARQHYTDFLARAECSSLRSEAILLIKKIDSRVKEAQAELVRLGCHNAPVSGKFDDATKKSLALYHSKKGSLADNDHLNDSLLSELKHQHLAVCPEQPAAPAVATPSDGTLPSEMPSPKTNKKQAVHEEDARPDQGEKAAGPARRDEEKAARPSTRDRIHRAAREQEPAARPQKQRAQSAAREAEPAQRVRQRPQPQLRIAKPRSYPSGLPRMPMGPAAGSGGSAVHGVGF